LRGALGVLVPLLVVGWVYLWGGIICEEFNRTFK